MTDFDSDFAREDGCPRCGTEWDAAGRCDCCEHCGALPDACDCEERLRQYELTCSEDAENGVSDTWLRGGLLD